MDISWMGGPAAKNHAVVFFFQLLAGNIFSNVCIADKLDAGSLHDFDPSVDDALVQLHIRNAVAQQTADSVMTFIDRYAVSAFVQVPGCRQSGRTAADDRDLLSGAYLWFFAFYQTIRVSIFNDRTFIFLRGNRFCVQPAGTGRLTQRGADPGSKFREAVCL